MFLPTSEPVVSEHLEATARLTSLGASPTMQTHVPQIAVLQFLGTTDREMGTVHFKSFAWSDGGEDLNSRNASDSMLKNQIFSCCVYTLQYLDRGFAFSQHARLHPRSLAALEPSPLILTLVRKCCTVPHVTIVKVSDVSTDTIWNYRLISHLSKLQTNCQTKCVWHCSLVLEDGV